MSEDYHRGPVDSKYVQQVSEMGERFTKSMLWLIGTAGYEAGIALTTNFSFSDFSGSAIAASFGLGFGAAHVVNNLKRAVHLYDQICSGLEG